VETLIVVVVVLAVLGLVALIVQIASRPPKDERRWDRREDEEVWDGDDY
jgi:hypothetical protein